MLEHLVTGNQWYFENGHPKNKNKSSKIFWSLNRHNLPDITFVPLDTRSNSF